MVEHVCGGQPDASSWASQGYTQARAGEKRLHLFRSVTRMIAFLCPLLLIATWVRFRALGAKSLWFNEAASSCFIDFSVGEIWARSSDPRAVHPPLYFVVLRIWSLLFGTSDLALRSLSAASGVIAVVGVFFLVRELARLGTGMSETRERYMAATAAICLALSPLQVHQSMQVRSYAFATALLVWCGWVLVRAIRCSGVKAARWWCLHVALAICLGYTHHLGLLSLLSQWVFAFLLICRINANSCRQVATSPSFHGLAVACAIFVGAYLVPWGYVLTHQSDTLKHDYEVKFNFQQVHDEIFWALFGTFDSYHDATSAETLTVGLLMTCALLLLAARFGPIGWYVAVTGLLPPLLMSGYSAMATRSIFQVRYLCFTQISWLMGLSILVWSTPNRWLNRGLASWLVATSVFAYASNGRTLGLFANPGMRAACRLILDGRRAGEPVVSVTHSMFYGLAHYTRGRVLPKLCVLYGGREGHRGAEQLKDNDLITFNKLFPADAPGLWLISSASHKHGVVPLPPLTPPPGWYLVGRWAFAQDYRSEAPLIVTHFSVVKKSCRAEANSSRPHMKSN